MKGVRVRKELGETTRKRLLEEGVLDVCHRIATDGDFVYLPVKASVEWAENIERDFECIVREETFDERVKRVIPPELVPLIRTFDSIGDIAVMEFSEELVPYSKEVAEAFLGTHKHFKTALLKGGSINGTFRTREYTLLAGEDRTATRHREHGLVFELDLEKVFFTPRLANERMRIANLVRPGECVIDMFCGVGPFSIAIAKYASPRIVYSIDLNPDAIEYLKRNVEINGVEGVVPVCGDAGEVVTGLPRGDRIIMNLPKISDRFLGPAFGNVAEGGTIHYYTITKDDEMDTIESFIDNEANRLGRKASIEDVVKIKPYSPYTYLTSFDIKVV